MRNPAPIPSRLRLLFSEPRGFVAPSPARTEKSPATQARPYGTFKNPHTEIEESQMTDDISSIVIKSIALK